MRRGKNKNTANTYSAAGLTALLFLLAAPLMAEETAITDGANTEAGLPASPYIRPLRGQYSALPEGLKTSYSFFTSSRSLGLFYDDDNELYQRYLKQYTSKGGKEWLEAVMKRAEPYIPFIREEIEKRGLPPELLCLPVIESGYSVKARSRSGAVGLWQFMKNSIAPFDMKVNEWVDERRDFWKSTDGALRKLEENYNYFGDWALALAAYNAGLGAVSRTVKQTGISDYWELSRQKKLKTETIHYVPKLLAVSRILLNPRQYGMEPSWPGNYQWVRIPVGRAASLSLLASEAGMDQALLFMANQELETGVTPIDKNYLLKVPAKDADSITAVLARKDIDLVKYYSHTIRSGDTLLALSLHYGVSVDQIEGMNPGIQPRYLRIGQRIIIPAFKEVGPYRHRAAAEERAFSGNHLVKKGESLWSIALAYDVDPELLAETNGMGMDSILREGRNLKVPQ
ncbi:MAG: transglycosylase SLT domain-containing protein [Treponema sp.]|jgi:membrane-bound lytic murein transglycosylase D|nr:transglycosylase SLT domain-containing protein [Treponema sp.]